MALELPLTRQETLPQVHRDAGRQVVPGSLELSSYAPKILRLLQKIKSSSQRLEGAVSIVIHG
jgi:hypothetical protein